jgi:hypothetical protein
MKAAHKIPNKLFLVDGKKIEAILRRAVRQALIAHKAAGNTIAVWRDDKVELIPAEEIRVSGDVSSER